MNAGKRDGGGRGICAESSNGAACAVREEVDRPAKPDAAGAARGAKSGRPLNVRDFGAACVRRFLCLVGQTDGDQCWPWLGTIDKATGYGRFKVGKRVAMAHRVAYEIERGPIPAGLVVDHLCRRRACVRPSHLQVVSQRINMLRGDSPTARATRAGTCKRGHQLTGGRECLPCKGIRKRVARERAAAVASTCVLGLVAGLAMSAACLPAAFAATVRLLCGGAS